MPPSPAAAAMPTILLASCVVAFSSLVALYVYRPSRRRQLPLPPGPEPTFLLGNLGQLPSREIHLAFAKWSEVYKSPLIFFRAVRQKIIVLNALPVAISLLDSRANIYSDRPFLWSTGELGGRKWAVFNISSQHARFKKYRKLLHSGLNARATQSYRQIQESELRILLHGLASTPNEFVSHIRRNAGAVVLKATYGWTVSGTDDHFISISEESVKLAAQFNRPGRWLVDVFPPLRFVPSWFPFVTFRKELAQFRQRMARVNQIPYEWAKEQINSGEYVESFTSQHLLHSSVAIDPEQEDIVRWCASAIYAGGADTITAALTAFVLMMTLHPDVQTQAQAEILQITGNNRLPNLDDQDKLPYVAAVIKETLRWVPPAPLGVPHRVTEDDVYEGYSIPKGTMVMANIWNFAHDPEMYPEPSEFCPERFLPSDGSEPQQDPRRFIFGFGRRVCPGSHFAEVSLFLAVSNILAAFDISKARDSEGREIEPEIALVTNTTTHVKPFACRITPRVPSLFTEF